VAYFLGPLYMRPPMTIKSDKQHSLITVSINDFASWNWLSFCVRSIDASQQNDSAREDLTYCRMSVLTGLPAINDVIRHRRIAIFGHIARLQDSTPAYKALQSHVNLSCGRLPHPSWSRWPGRPRGRWIDQIRSDTSQTPADLWRQALGRSHHGRATRQPTLAMRWWW